MRFVGCESSIVMTGVSSVFPQPKKAKSMKRSFSYLVLAAVLCSHLPSARALLLPVAEDTSSTATGKINETTGKAVTLTVTSKEQAFLIFDLSTLPASVTASNITSARLNLYVSSVTTPGELTVHLVTNQWQENTASVPAPKYSSNVVGTIATADLAAKSFIEVDVTSAVSNWFNGQSNFGFAIATDTGKVRLASKEGLGTGFPAMLEIETADATLLNVSQLTNGTLPLSSLPAAVVTNAEEGVTLGGTFIGNGSGLTNLNSANFVPTFGCFYLIQPNDDPSTIAVGSAIPFPETGPTNGISRSSASQFTLPAIGIYEVTWQVSITEAGQLDLATNGTELPQTVVGRATGTSQIVGDVLIQTTTLNTLLDVRNPTGNSTALTVTPDAGGTTAVSGTLVIKRIQ